MELIHWRLLVDFGLVVLIWLVQLVIYPSFQYCKSADLLSWHNSYTRRMSVIVMPLMLAQLALATIHTLTTTSLLAWCSLLLIVIVWLITFAYFIPAHRKISEGETGPVLIRILRVNWWRTWLWSAVFLLGIVDILLN